jgi:hypothetical protein
MVLVVYKSFPREAMRQIVLALTCELWFIVAAWLALDYVDRLGVTIDKPVQELFEARSGQQYRVHFRVRNFTLTPVRILGANIGCSSAGCVSSVEPLPVQIPRWDSRDLVAVVTPARARDFRFELVIHTDSPSQPRLTLVIAGKCLASDDQG